MLSIHVDVLDSAYVCPASMLNVHQSVRQTADIVLIYHYNYSDLSTLESLTPFIVGQKIVQSVPDGFRAARVFFIFEHSI
jgi:hypothetical protein